MKPPYFDLPYPHPDPTVRGLQIISHQLDYLIELLERREAGIASSQKDQTLPGENPKGRPPSPGGARSLVIPGQQSTDDYEIGVIATGPSRRPAHLQAEDAQPYTKQHAAIGERVAERFKAFSKEDQESDPEPPAPTPKDSSPE